MKEYLKEAAEKLQSAQNLLTIAEHEGYDVYKEFEWQVLCALIHKLEPIVKSARHLARENPRDLHSHT